MPTHAMNPLNNGGGNRTCRTCKRDRSRAYRAAQKEA
jgi:hypothetical protein